MSDESNTWQELLALRSLTETTGVIHDAQKLQLQYWGPLMLPHAKDIEIGIQLPWVENEGAPDEKHHDLRVVEFRVGSTGKKAPKDLNKRVRYLGEWVKRLLGDRFTVRVVVRGKVIFEGKGKSLKKKTK